MALFAFGIFIIEAGLYLFAPFDWIATIPVYYEIVVAAIYILAAVVGWCALVRFVIQWTLASHILCRWDQTPFAQPTRLGALAHAIFFHSRRPSDCDLV